MHSCSVEDAFSQWASTLTQYATMLVGPDDADDVVADVFVQLARSPERIHEIRDLRPYLYRAVLNAVRMRSRGRQRLLRREQAAWSISVLPPAADLLADANVVAAVRRLSAQQRAVIYLTYWEDAEVQAVAATLGVGEGTVRRQLARARSKLREALR